MPSMFVTLEVSKLSGWLNALAFYRVERWACDEGRVMDREAGGRWVEATLAIGVHGEGPTQGYRGQGTRGAHSEHGADVRDLGRVEAERLVER